MLNLNMIHIKCILKISIALISLLSYNSIASDNEGEDIEFIEINSSSKRDMSSKSLFSSYSSLYTPTCTSLTPIKIIGESFSELEKSKKRKRSPESPERTATPKKKKFMDMPPLGKASNAQSHLKIINNAQANLEDTQRAVFRLAKMDDCKLRSKLDDNAARAMFISNRDNTDLSKNKRATALYHLAEMDLFGCGGDVNYIAARAGFQASLNNALYVEKKATAQFRLAEMDYFGYGGDINYVAARAGFLAARANPYLPQRKRITAIFRLAEMDYFGYGGDINYNAARAGFSLVLNNTHLQENYRATARLHLAEMAP